MSTATITATTTQTAIQASEVEYVSEGPEGYTFTVTPHAPTAR